MRFSILLAATTALALAGCDSTPDEAPATADSATPAVPADADGTGAPAPAPSATAMPTAIPAAFQGRFGLVAKDCTSTMGDAKGLLEVSADKLKFYESVGTLKEITQATEGRIRGSFGFTGEGMEWQRDEVMDLRDGGKVLVRREFGEGASPEAFTYTRCE